jgi:hypothetical protein
MRPSANVGSPGEAALLPHASSNASSFILGAIKLVDTLDAPVSSFARSGSPRGGPDHRIPRSGPRLAALSAARTSPGCVRKRR